MRIKWLLGVFVATARIARDTTLREDLGAAGREFALRFSWERAAELTRQHLVKTIDDSDRGRE